MRVGLDIVPLGFPIPIQRSRIIEFGSNNSNSTLYKCISLGYMREVIL